MTPDAYLRSMLWDTVGDDDVPHRDDWWISTDDVLDYARWLEHQIQAVERVLLDAQRSGDGAELAAANTFSVEWIPYRARWSAFRQALEASWWDRVNAWDRIVAFHEELRRLSARGRELGMPLRDLAAPPRDAEALTSLVRDVREAAVPTAALVAIAAAAVAVALVVRR